MQSNKDCSKHYMKSKVNIKTKSVKECLQPEVKTRFQMLMTNIKNDIIIKRNQKEIGKANTRLSTLPPTLDPIYTSFGFIRRYPLSSADIIHGEYLNYLDSDSNHFSKPGTQIDRKYLKPFNKNKSFGKESKANSQGSRARTLIYNSEKVDYNQFEDRESNRTLQQIFDLRRSQNSTLPNMYETLREAPINRKIIEMKKCLAYINKMRSLLKKRDSNFIFSDLKDQFECIDKGNTTTIQLNKFYDVLSKAQIKLNMEMFGFFLNEFNLIVKNLIYYEKALNLLNWKYEFPSISKIHDIPEKFQYYTTTYQDTMKTRISKFADV